MATCPSSTTARGFVVVAGNTSIPAYKKDEGDREVISATLPADDGYRVWSGGDFREVTFTLRRPHLYRAYSDENNFGPLRGTSEGNE